MDPERRELSVILFLSDFPPFEEIVGGGEVRPYEFVRSLQRRGAHTRVWCARPERIRNETTPTLRVRTIRPTLRPLREALMPVLAVAAFVRSVIADRRGGRRPILWLRAPGNVSWKSWLPIIGEPGMFCLPFARLLRVPVWASNHDISPDHELDKIRQRNLAGIVDPHLEKAHMRSGRANARLQRFAFKRATIVSAVSDGTQHELMQRYGLLEKTTPVIRAGVNPDMFDLAEWQPPPSTWRVGYIGSFADADTQLLLDTLRLLSEDDRFSFVIGGNGFESVSTDLLPEPNRLTHWRDTRYAQLGQLAHEVDIWLVPLGDFQYQRWAWPLKIPMYMATGRPVVITEHPELDSAGVRALVFVAPELTAESLVATVCRVANSAADSAARSAKARRYALDVMSWDVQFARGFDALSSQ